MKPAVPGQVYFRYVAASAVSLGVDLGLFSAAIASGAAAVPASILGYSAGILSHWLISSRFVFGDRVVGRGERRGGQQALFVASALAGLAVTTLVVGAGDLLGAPPLVSKLSAVVVGFQLTYFLRKKVVFA